MPDKKEQPVQLIVQNCPTDEDEIDLRELWQTIKKNRKTVYATTTFFFIVALLYILIKTPLYEAKSVLEIGYIGNKPIESAQIVAQKIKTVFYVDDPKLREKIDKEAFVQDASPIRKVNKLIKITTYGISNDKAIQKAQEVVDFVQKDEALKIAQFKKETQAQIDKLQRDIEKLELFDVKKINDKISLLKSQDLKRIEEKIKLTKEQDLKKIDDQIDIYKNGVIPNIANKIDIATQQIEKFEKNIENLQKSINGSMDKAFVALTLVQISNYQNMIYSRQLKINDLKLQKEKILKETIPNLERQKERILKETIPNLERQKERILKETIPNLERQKDQILKIEIPKLKDQIEALRYKLTPAYISTTKPVGDIQTYDKPAKPKKKLILAVALISGLIVGIFLVFFLEFLKNVNEEEK